MTDEKKLQKNRFGISSQGSGIGKSSIDRRKFLGSAAALSVGSLASRVATADVVDVSRNQRRSMRSMLYPPYATAEESDRVYAAHVSAGHVDFLKQMPAMNIQYGERKNGRVRDAYTGKWFWDCQRNGSKYNLGHRNPEIMAAMSEACSMLDAGNFAQLSGYRAKLAEKLVASTGGKLTGVTYGCSGAEAIEIAIHAARSHTKKRGLVAIGQTSYHGGTDLALSISGVSESKRERYLVASQEVTFVPYNDLEAMKAAITNETAAVVIEPSPAQAGFPVPSADYFTSIKAVCEERNVVLIADEVQTGLGGCGRIWAYENFGIVPDIVCAGKGLGGGVYPISAAIMKESIWKSYTDGQFVAHESTYAGSDIGCVVASKVLDLTSDPIFLGRVGALTDRFKKGFDGLPIEYSHIGLCMGLRTADPFQLSAKLLSLGVLAVPSFVDNVVPFRPILTLTDKDADEIIQQVQRAFT